MADMTELKNIVRLGTVQSVNASKMTARVKFKDKGGITSGDLRIIKRPVYVSASRAIFVIFRWVMSIGVSPVSSKDVSTSL